MTLARSLCIASTHLDAAAYTKEFGWTLAPLPLAAGSAKTLAALAERIGPGPVRTLAPRPRADAVLAALTKDADEVERGNYLLTFSGHGVRFKEKRGFHEGWCLADRVLFDAEIQRALSRFAREVCVVVVSDCCYAAGTVEWQAGRVGDHGPKIVSLAACLAHQLSFDGKTSSAFVEALGHELDRTRGRPTTYASLIGRIKKALDRQTPTLTMLTKTGSGRYPRPFWAAER